MPSGDDRMSKRPSAPTWVGPISVRTVATNIEIAPLVGSDDLVAEARRIFGEDLVDVGEVT